MYTSIELDQSSFKTYEAYIQLNDINILQLN